MNLHKFYLNENFFIKLIEFPALYNIKTDELYCLDEKALSVLKHIHDRDFSSINIDEKELKELIDFCLKEGILTEKPVQRLNPPIKQAPFPSLRYIELQITKRCNLRCKHCFVGDAKPVDLPFEKIKKVLREFEQMQGLRVLVTGGEPILHPEFEKINDIMPDFALRRILFTNGVLLNDEILKKLNFHEIQISIDGMAHGHESLRGKGTFQKAIDAVKRALEHGFDVSVATVIHKENLNEFDELENLLKSLGIREWTVDALTVFGNLKNNQEFWVSPEIAGKIMKRYGFTKEQHPRAEGFGCGVHLLAVLATGEAAFCSFFEDNPLGNIDEGLENLWKKKKHVLLKELECSRIGCQFIDECFGGCRARAMTLSGKKDSRDLFKCHQFETLKP